MLQKMLGRFDCSPVLVRVIHAGTHNHSTLPIGFSCSTLEMKVNFVRQITSRTGLVRSNGKIIHVGSTIATAEGKLVDCQGELHAHAVTTRMISRGHPKV